MAKKTYKHKLKIALAGILIVGALGADPVCAMGAGGGPAAIESGSAEQAAATSEDVTAAFRDAAFRAAVRKILRLGSDAPITRSACAEAEVLDISGLGIKDLAGIEYFTGLYQLRCYENQLTSIDLSHCPGLTYLICSENQLRSLDLSRCPRLEFLYCGYNPLAGLDLSPCPGLNVLSCGGLGLTSLDLSRFTDLRMLFCDDNQLSDLDLSRCPRLESLSCRNNQLTGLDVSRCPLLSGLTCDENNMKSVNDVKGRNSRLTGDAFCFSPQRGEKRSQTLIVSPQALHLYVGGKTQALKVTGAKGAVTYTTDKPKVAKINAKGTVTPLSKGTATITIRASGDGTYKAASAKVRVSVYNRPAAVKNIKAAPARAKGTLKVTWKKVPDASGYTIRYAYKSNMKGARTVRVPKGGTVSATIKKLSSKKTVYIQIQAYSIKGNITIPGAWSKTSRSTGKIR